MRDLNNFIATLRTGSLAVQNQYVIQLQVPAKFNFVGLDSNTISLYCKDTNIPQLSLNTAHIQNIEMPWENAHSANYSGFHCNFYVDSSLRMRRFFELWMGEIYNTKTHSMGWYDDYTTNMTVYVLSKDQIPVYSYTLEGVFPKSIPNTDLSYSSNDTFMEFPVDFAFQFMVNDAVTMQRNTVTNVQAPNGSIFLSHLIKPENGQDVTFVMPADGGSDNTFLSSIQTMNGWIDAGFQTAGSIYNMYRGAMNVKDDITGAVSKSKEMLNAIKNGKGNPDAIFGAATQLGSLAKNNPITRAIGGDNVLTNASSVKSKSSLF